MPVPLLMAAPAIAQTAAGLFQTLFSGKKRAANELESQINQSPTYNVNKGIRDYYQEALSRYNESPYQLAQYLTNVNNARSSTAQGIGALQDRRSALAGIGKLVGLQNNATQNAVAQAEQQRNQRFSQLGGATNMLAGEERKAFDVNKLSPYLRRLQLNQMKLGAANARFDAGLNNIFQGGSNATSMFAMGGKGGNNFFNRGDFSGNQ